MAAGGGRRERVDGAFSDATAESRPQARRRAREPHGPPVGNRRGPHVTPVRVPARALSIWSDFL